MIRRRKLKGLRNLHAFFGTRSAPRTVIDSVFRDDDSLITEPIIMNTTPAPGERPEGNTTCPDCGVQLVRFDRESWRCPENCGFYHDDDLPGLPLCADPRPWKAPSTTTPRTDSLFDNMLLRLQGMHQGHVHPDHFLEDVATVRNEMRSLEAELAEAEAALRKEFSRRRELESSLHVEQAVNATMKMALAAPTPDGGVKCTCESVKALPGGGVPMCPTCERESEAEKASGRLSFHGALRLLADIPDSTERDRLKKAIYEKSSYMADDTLFPEIARRIREFAEKASASDPYKARLIHPDYDQDDPPIVTVYPAQQTDYEGHLAITWDDGTEDLADPKFLERIDTPTDTQRLEWLLENGLFTEKNSYFDDKLVRMWSREQIDEFAKDQTK